MTVGGAVIFADHVGAALVRAALPPACPAVLVADPARGHPPDGDFELSLLHPTRPERAAFVSRLALLKPRLGIVCSYSRILWPELLAAFPYGVVNLHNGRLPEYRGANTLQWTLINGESEIDATLHYVVADVDAGPVIAARTVSIDEGDDALSLREKLCAAGRALLAERLPDLLERIVAATPQDEANARRWPRRRPEDGEIDWSYNDLHISNMTRALVPPWPGVVIVAQDGRRTVINRALSVGEVGELRRATLPPTDADTNAEIT